jgi:hypothetical protein
MDLLEFREWLSVVAVPESNDAGSAACDDDGVIRSGGNGVLPGVGTREVS